METGRQVMKKRLEGEGKYECTVEDRSDFDQIIRRLSSSRQFTALRA
ncbi:MAG: hypothetical protein HN354_09880 [Deltaproteobacteria bacterium]|nr:hypothetical protein [Deltaproteobacteria bacterium]